jgi:hypothetical protein
VRDAEEAWVNEVERLDAEVVRAMNAFETVLLLGAALILACLILDAIWLRWL